MAGLAGWAVPVQRTLDEAGLVPMLEALAERNASGNAEPLVCYSGSRRHQQVVLGATLCDPGSGIALAFDGALLDAAELRTQLARKGFAFSGTGHAEVLLRAYQYWDKDVVKQLRGAFAFALWDPRKDRLMLARDRFGEKPLHVHERGEGLFFASEAKALLAAPGARAELDRGAMRACIAHGYAGGRATLFRGIRRLAPGTYAMWQFGRLQETRYWVPPDRNAYARGPGRDAVEGFTAALAQSARSRAGADAAGGILLSGGIDSAALVAVLAQGGRTLKTFTPGFEGERTSELPQAAAVAKHFGTEHREIVVKPAELLPALAGLVARQDAPVRP
jgi:asparagine synthase (glutamine-hydrolysing)